MKHNGTVTGFYLPLGQNSCESWDSPMKKEKRIKPKYIGKYYHQKLSSHSINQYLHSACAIIDCFSVPCIHSCLAVPWHMMFQRKVFFNGSILSSSPSLLSVWETGFEPRQFRALLSLWFMWENGTVEFQILWDSILKFYKTKKSINKSILKSHIAQ